MAALERGGKRGGYKPEHGEDEPGVGLKNTRNEAGYGATDGVQSEGDEDVAHELVNHGSGDGEDDGGGYRVRTGWTKRTRYTGIYDKG